MTQTPTTPRLSLKVDPAREHNYGYTGILVRAQDSAGNWVNADIADLDVKSLNAWLRSRGGNNPWAEGVVRHLLGHRDG